MFSVFQSKRSIDLVSLYARSTETLPRCDDQAVASLRGIWGRRHYFSASERRSICISRFSEKANSEAQDLVPSGMNMRTVPPFIHSKDTAVLAAMRRGFTVYSFPLGTGPAMGYEAGEEAAYKAARQHRATVLADPTTSVLPTRTPINRVVLRPVSVEVVVAILNEHEIGLLDLIETTELIGYVE